MSRVKHSNPIARKIFSIIFGIIIIAAIIFVAIKVLLTNNTLAYDIGEKQSSTVYEDVLLNNYEEYVEFADKYNIRKDLEVNNFNQYLYLASFQDYDSCSEKKTRSVSSISTSETSIDISYKIYNKCGWCRSHIMIYLVKIDKLEYSTPKINYSYEYERSLNCGTI